MQQSFRCGINSYRAEQIVMTLFLQAYQRRTCQLNVTVNGADGTPEIFAAGDVFRVKIGSAGQSPVLDLDSVTPTDSGSSLTAANPSRLYLHQDDLVFPPGAYDMEVSIVDDSDGDTIKHAEKGVFVLHPTELGDVGLT